MKSFIKSAVQNIISLLPSRLADTVYYFIQRRAGRLRHVDPLLYLEQALMLMQCAKTGHMMEGRTVFEIGTGRTANVPFAFWLAGAGRVITADLNRYLRPELVVESLYACRARKDGIIGLFSKYQIPLNRDRLESLLACTTAGEALTTACVEYRAPADAAQTGLPDSCVDFYVSVNVLEHIPPTLLAAIFSEAWRVVRPGGLVIHQVDPSDHFAQTDASLNAVNFLRYNPTQWKRRAGNRFMYQNRLRAPEYLRLVMEAGFKIGLTESEQDERALRELASGFPLHPDFSHYSLRDLSTTKLVFIAERLQARHTS